MRIQTIILFLLSSISTFGQLPEKPEDVSPLLIGEKIPVVMVQTLNGKEVSTENLFREGKSIVIFYRGGWCPYCNTQMAQIQTIEKELIGMGYQILAVSPDTPEKLKESLDKNKLTYTLISDKTGAFSKAVGIAFQAPGNYEKRLKAIQGEEAELHLPVPSVFIVNESGEILFEYINPNYKVRMTSELLLAVARVFADKNK